MSKAEEFIQQNVKDCTNKSLKKGEYYLWLSPDQARKAVEIAREEIYEWLRQVSLDNYKIADEESYRMGFPYDYIDVNRLISNLKQAIRDE